MKTHSKVKNTIKSWFINHMEVEEVTWYTGSAATSYCCEKVRKATWKWKREHTTHTK